MITVIIGVAFPRFRVEQSIRFFLVVPTLIGLIGLVIALW
jgi:hypothetical protein